MTPEEKAAFINSQTALMLIEREIMTAENLEREQQGFSHVNGPKQWQDLYDNSFLKTHLLVGWDERNNPKI